VDEEVVMLEEQLATANADIERLQARVADAEAAASTRGEELATLRQRVAEQETRLAEYGAELDDTRGAYETQGGQLRDAVARLRQALLEREPHLPGDIVTGETVAELDAAIETARQTVAQVRQHLEQQAQTLRIPAGAPARAGPDVSSLSAAEKIRLGLRQT
jgi:DNA repair exonuclease SbcCD ATPase subunit